MVDKSALKRKRNKHHRQVKILKKNFVKYTDVLSEEHFLPLDDVNVVIELPDLNIFILFLKQAEK